MSSRTKKDTTRWEHFSHDADMGLCGYGTAPAQAFEQIAHAMTAVITREAIEPKYSVNIRCEAPDLELLLVDWLNALIYEMATRRLLFSRFDVTIANNVLSGTAWGESIDVKRHRPAVEIKGATLTALSVKETDGEWSARCVIDV